MISDFTLTNLLWFFLFFQPDSDLSWSCWHSQLASLKQHHNKKCFTKRVNICIKTDFNYHRRSWLWPDSWHWLRDNLLLFPYRPFYLLSCGLLLSGPSLDSVPWSSPRGWNDHLYSNWCQHVRHWIKEIHNQPVKGLPK